MHVGKRIFYLRKIKKISQRELSKGIISSSHLSNIESGRFEPKSDIIILIAIRLDVDPNYLLRTQDVDECLDFLLCQLERELLNSNYIQAKKLFREIITKYRYINCVIQELYLALLEKLLSLRLNDIENATAIYEKLNYLYDKNTFKSLDQNIKKLFYYVNALYSYYQKDFLRSYDFYLKQLSLVSNDLEKAKTFYNISLVLLKLNDPLNALSYANFALEIYLFSHNFEMAVDVYILLSVLYWDNQQLISAEETIIKAKHISEKYCLERGLDKIYHNLGLIHQSKKDYDIALQYYYKTLEIKKGKNSNLLLTYRSLIETYLELRDVKSAKTILISAYPFCKSQSDLCVLNILSAKIDLFEGNYQNYEKCMEESINFLNKINDIKNVLNLAEELGAYFQKKKKYKKAAKYFEVSLLVQKSERRLI